MAARFWKVTGLEPRQGGAVSLSEFALYDSFGRVDLTSTLTSTIPPGQGTLASLSDDAFVDAAAWDEVRLPGFALQWDLGVDKSVSAVGVSSPSAELSLASCQVFFSNDGVDWAPAGVAAFDYTSPTSLSKYSSLDEHPSKVVLLHTCRGRSALQDASLGWKTIAVEGGVALSSEVLLQGGEVLKLQGGASALTTSSTDFQFSTDAITMEAWVYALSADNGGFGNLTVANEGGAGISFWLTGGGSFRVRIGSSVAGQFDDVMGVGTFPVNQWVHVAVTREHTGTNGIKLWIAGALNAQGTSVRGVNSTRFAVGRPCPSEGSGGLLGYIGGAKITRGLARYIAPFTPPEGRFESAVLPFALPLRSDAPSPVGLHLAGGAAPGPTQSAHAPFYLSKDIYDSGRGRVIGTVKEKGTPNAPLKREVFLFDQITWRQIRATWSDPVTGEYVFDEVDMNRKYAVVAEDYAHMYRAVIADNLSPELMPQFV